MKTGTFYLSSLDSIKFADVRECVFIRKLQFDSGKECALVKLTPPVIGQDFNLGYDVENFVLANRHEGDTLFPIKEFPCFVFVALPRVEDIESRSVISKDDVEVVAWGEIYRSRSDAEKHSFD